MVRSRPTDLGDDELVEAVLRRDDDSRPRPDAAPGRGRRLRCPAPSRRGRRRSKRPSTSSGRKAGAATRRTPRSGPVISSPSALIAATCSASRSTNSTVVAARTKAAPTVPPMAPAPQIRIGARSRPAVLDAGRASRRPRRPRSPACPRRAARRAAEIAVAQEAARRLGGRHGPHAGRDRPSAFCCSGCDDARRAASRGNSPSTRRARRRGSISCTFAQVLRARSTSCGSGSRMPGWSAIHSMASAPRRLVAAMAVDDQRCAGSP